MIDISRPVGWGCRIHWLHLCRGARAPHSTSVLIMTLNHLSQVGWGCRIHGLHLCRGVTHLQWVSWYDVIPFQPSRQGLLNTLHLCRGIRPLPTSVLNMTLYYLSPVSWSCRIHGLHLCIGVRPPPTSVLDKTLNSLMVRF